MSLPSLAFNSSPSRLTTASPCDRWTFADFQRSHPRKSLRAPKFAVKNEIQMRTRAVSHKGHNREKYRAIPFPFYWNNRYAEFHCKTHRGGNSIGRYSTSSTNVDHVYRERCVVECKHRAAKLELLVESLLFYGGSQNCSCSHIHNVRVKRQVFV